MNYNVFGIGLPRCLFLWLKLKEANNWQTGQKMI